ncbi:MAG: S8 family peptidase [Lachnospiraceae bacterium]
MINRYGPKGRHLTGSTVGVAVLDTGIYPHIDFLRYGNRIIAFQDFVNHMEQPYDDNGHGTHVAGIIASNGIHDRHTIGIAPGAKLIICKVLDRNGNGKVDAVLSALEWIKRNHKKYNIRIVNISVGTPAKGVEDENSILVRKVNEIWDCGLVVVVAAGNYGPKSMSVTTPGISRKVITVGSYDKEMYKVGQNSSSVTFSGTGPTVSCIRKPDLVAPGADIYSCLNAPNAHGKKSGTSMSTPMVSGAVALLLEDQPHLSNRLVKLRLRDSCRDMGLLRNQQGWGMLDVERLLLSRATI